jgi:flagellar biosynthetic protein FliQ
MNGELILYLGRRTLETALLLAAPVLIVTLVVGFLVAMMQAVTSIRDMTLGLVVKLASVAVTLLVCGSWMLHQLVGFAKDVLCQMQAVGH